MAGQWIKMRSGLMEDPAVWRIGRAIDEPAYSVVALLYWLADWFEQQGHQGKMEVDNRAIDLYVGHLDFAGALEDEGWLESNGCVRFLSGFCSTSRQRKSLGRAIRAEILHGAACAACGSSSGLCIDHIVPVVRGGTCERENLQPLCQSCNARKGRMTMDEFMEARQ